MQNWQTHDPKLNSIDHMPFILCNVELHQHKAHWQHTHTSRRICANPDQASSMSTSCRRMSIMREAMPERTTSDDWRWMSRTFFSTGIYGTPRNSPRSSASTNVRLPAKPSVLYMMRRLLWNFCKMVINNGSVPHWNKAFWKREKRIQGEKICTKRKINDQDSVTSLSFYKQERSQLHKWNYSSEFGKTKREMMHNQSLDRAFRWQCLLLRKHIAFEMLTQAILECILQVLSFECSIS